MTHRFVIGGTDSAYIEHDGVVSSTDKAKCFQIENELVWVPRSQILDENDELVAIPKWLADKKGLESAW